MLHKPETNQPLGSYTTPTHNASRCARKEEWMKRLLGQRGINEHDDTIIVEAAKTDIGRH